LVVARGYHVAHHSGFGGNAYVCIVGSSKAVRMATENNTVRERHTTLALRLQNPEMRK